MYAVVQTGGKQYKVSPGDVIVVEKLAGNGGDTVELSNVLMLDDGTKVQLGQPFLSNAVVKASIVEQDRAKKIIVFKKKRRQNYRRKNGHRQDITVLRVSEIKGEGFTAKAEPKKVAAKVEAVVETKAPVNKAPVEKAAAPKAKAAAPKAAPAKKADAAQKAPDKKPAAKKAPAAKPTDSK